MSRDNSTYKDIYNRALTLLRLADIGESLPTEAELARTWYTSRTTVRAVLTRLRENGLIDWAGRDKTILRAPRRKDYYATNETITTSQKIETEFTQYILGGELKPGAILHEAALVRKFGVSTSVVREFLIRFSRYGLIEKEPNRHWILRGFTSDFADELSQVRTMFERHGFEKMLATAANSPARKALHKIRSEHQHFIDKTASGLLTFASLDEDFHKIWIDPMDNRFISDFFGLVSVVFHDHYRWNKVDEQKRNLVAASQHLAIIDAVMACDDTAAIKAFETHMDDAHKTLLTSVTWEL